MKSENFEFRLPAGYKKVKVMDAKNLGFGLLLTVGSLILFAIALVPVVLPLFLLDETAVADVIWNELHLIILPYFVGTFVYMILHELTHGAAYKLMTGEKLTFGISWNCAFCGVPNVFTYRRTAIIAIYSPFVLFTLLFVPGMVIAFLLKEIALYICLGLIFATHISGCIGDLYMGHMLLFKYKNPRVLCNDTGPCVTIFDLDSHYVDKK